MSPERRPLTTKSLAILVAGLVLLVGLSVYRLAPTRTKGLRLETFTGETMGTVYAVKVVAPSSFFSGGGRDRAAERISAELDSVNRKMSAYLPDSELSRFNAFQLGEPFSVSAATLEAFSYAREVSAATNGAFDITVGPLVNLWGFGPEGRQEAPSEDEIEALRNSLGYQKVTIDKEAGTLFKSRPDLYCDLSAIAKGFAVDRVAEALDELGFEDYLVEVGGEVRTGGVNLEGAAWRIGIETPISGERTVHRVVALSGWSMATSGDYRNYYEEDGVRVSHTINPRTGRPIAHRLASVSVIHEVCALADAYATAFMVLGPDQGFALAEELEIAAVFIVHAGDGAFEELTTQAFSERFE